MEYKIKAEGLNRFYDFKIKNIILELNGDYYHANPKKYNADDDIIIHHVKYKVKDIWEYDLRKKIIAENNGFKVVYLWECDIIKLKDDALWQWLNENVLTIG